jgi:isopenicillin-N N-acyltransferase-like protein
MKTKPFPFFRLEGSPHEVGRQHGVYLGDRIQTSVDFYTERFASRVGLSWQAVLSRADAMTERLRGESSALVAEMEGIAKGSDQPTGAIVALNARTMLLRSGPGDSKGTRSSAASEIGGAECTTGALLPAATADGHTILFGDWDQHQRLLDNSAFLEIRIPDRPAIFVLTEAGILIRTGFNEHGVGITGNSLVSDADNGSLPGTPWPIVRRRVLAHDCFATAVKEVFAAERSHSANHVIGDAEGFAVVLEATPPVVFTMCPESDVIAHSNHFLTPGARARLVDIQVGTSPSTLYRNRRVQEPLQANHGSITVADVKTVLWDHFGHPQSVCAHPGPTNSVTVSSHIADLTTRTMMISSGPPCENEYQTFQLDPS